MSYTVRQSGEVIDDGGSCDSSQAVTFPHNAKSGIRDSGYAGDGFLTSIRAYTCSTVTPPLRMRQRDDFFNTPRIPTAQNQPSSFQASIRKTWNGTYLMDEEPCLC